MPGCMHFVSGCHGDMVFLTYENKILTWILTFRCLKRMSKWSRQVPKVLLPSPIGWHPAARVVHMASTSQYVNFWISEQQKTPTPIWYHIWYYIYGIDVPKRANFFFIAATVFFHWRAFPPEVNLSIDSHVQARWRTSIPVAQENPGTAVHHPMMLCVVCSLTGAISIQGLHSRTWVLLCNRGGGPPPCLHMRVKCSNSRT